MSGQQAKPMQCFLDYLSIYKFIFYFYFLLLSKILIKGKLEGDFFILKKLNDTLCFEFTLFYIMFLIRRTLRVIVKRNQINV